MDLNSFLVKSVDLSLVFIARDLWNRLFGDRRDDNRCSRSRDHLFEVVHPCTVFRGWIPAVMAVKRSPVDFKLEEFS